MKLKNHKAASKKIRVTKSKRHKKLLTKKAGQDHFNARESGKVTRTKRRKVGVAKSDQRNIKRLLPYNY
jgi:ribosomal protein L35